jgi:hypothetical protein
MQIILNLQKRIAILPVQHNTRSRVCVSDDVKIWQGLSSQSTTYKNTSISPRRIYKNKNAKKWANNLPWLVNQVEEDVTSFSSSKLRAATAGSVLNRTHCESTRRNY